MTFEYKRPSLKDAKHTGSSNGNGAGSHDPVAPPAAAASPAIPARPATPAADPLSLDDRVSRYIPTPPPPHDYGRENAIARAEKQSLKSLRLREHLDCEPPWDIQRARASFDSPASPHEPWPDRFDVWPADMAGYWPCPICATALPPVDRTPMKVFRCVGCETETFVHVKAPVVECPRHGRHEIDLPWMQNDLKWTYLGTEPAESAHPVATALRDISEGTGETEH
jgi:hypothetical protein